MHSFVIVTRLIIQVTLVVQKTGVLLVRIANAKFASVYSDEEINDLLEARERTGSRWYLCWCNGGGTNGKCPGEVGVNDH